MIMYNIDANKKTKKEKERKRRFLIFNVTVIADIRRSPVKFQKDLLFLCCSGLAVAFFFCAKQDFVVPFLR